MPPGCRDGEKRAGCGSTTSGGIENGGLTDGPCDWVDKMPDGGRLERTGLGRPPTAAASERLGDFDGIEVMNGREA
jgi:hypothetical protein